MPVVSAPATPSYARVSFSGPRSYNSPRNSNRSLHISPSSSVSTPYSNIDTNASHSPVSKTTTPASKISSRPSPNGHHKSLADVAENWRIGAKRNSLQFNSEGFSTVKPDLLPAPRLFNMSPPAQYMEHRASWIESRQASERFEYTTPPRENSRDTSRYGRHTDPVRLRSRSDKDNSCDLIEGDMPSPRNLSYRSSNTAEGDDAAALPQCLNKKELSKFVPSCSVCGCSSSGVVVLDPCAHLLCSSCLTGSLNIVGEKSFSCTLCSSPVANFSLRSASFITPPKSALVDSSRTVSSAIEHCDSHFSVMRIDNVPWDVTPPAIIAWLNQVNARVHILLDEKGKTLSHSFVEIPSEDARIALHMSRNKVLGSGKRARSVTVTLSSQEELMRAVFPLWKGSFRRFTPTLDGLNHEGVAAALEHGLINQAELRSLLHLLQSPESHFLKDPTLPFWKLASILQKFPTDHESRIFWTCGLRDSLFDIAYLAIQILVSKEPFEEHDDLIDSLGEAACNNKQWKVFTVGQIEKVHELLSGGAESTGSASLGDHPAKANMYSDSTFTHLAGYQARLQVVAQEFGLDTSVIHALMGRLAELGV